MIRRAFALVVAGVVALHGRHAAAEDLGSLEWSAPLSCPARDAILDRLRQGNEPFGAMGSTDARVTIEQAAEDRYRARVDLVVGHQWSSRSLEASTCEAIADAFAVMVRVAAAAAPVVPAPPPPVPSPAPAVASPPVVPRPVVVDESWARGFSARAALAVDLGTRADVTPGFGIGIAWRRPHLAIALDLNAFAPPPPQPMTPVFGLIATSAPPASAGAVVFDGYAQTDPHIWLLTASAEACASEPLRNGRVLVEACGGLVFEHPRFMVDGFGVVPVMGDLAAEWWPFPAVGFRGSARFLLDLPRTAPSLVAFEPALGVVARLGE